MTRPGRTAGFVVHEAILALALAVTLVVGVTQLLVLVAQQRRLAREQTVAQEEAGNLLETLMTRSWDDTTAQRLAAVELSPECRRWLAEAQLRVEVNDEAADVRRIALELAWRPFCGGRAAPLRLTGWKFRATEVAP